MKNRLFALISILLLLTFLCAAQTPIPHKVEVRFAESLTSTLPDTSYASASVTASLDGASELNTVLDEYKVYEMTQLYPEAAQFDHPCPQVY
ncbi:MAG TPA: hypothetical protein VFG10_19445 [Saprospiraceae bacterium]|nr:hypothetical protein [Saprospiraceae bacterium]